MTSSWSSVAENLRVVLHVAKCGDAARQVEVGVEVAGAHPAHQREHGPVVNGVEQPRDDAPGTEELEHGELTARSQDPQRLGARARDVREVADPEGAEDGVLGAILQFDVVRVHVSRLDLLARGALQLPGPHVEHAGAEIATDELGVRVDAMDGLGGIEGAGAEVEDANVLGLALGRHLRRHQ